MADSRSAIDSAPRPYPSFQQQEAGPRRFKIPKKLKKGYKTLLAATEEDYTLGRVREIKCRWCSRHSFKRWKDFKRHCNTSEVHPLKIIFCEWCGRHFTSTDALKKHNRYQASRPENSCTMREVDVRKRRRKTEEAHRKFIEELDLPGTGSFSGIIRNMMYREALYGDLVPDSEKDLASSSECCPPARSEEDAALSSECCTLVDPEEDVAHC